jgi:hypothetical protein
LIAGISRLPGYNASVCARSAGADHEAKVAALIQSPLVDSELSLQQHIALALGPHLVSTYAGSAPEGDLESWMMAQPVPHQLPGQQKKRVKVYELRDNDWFDRGTGFCSTTLIETPDQAEDPDSKEAQLLVHSEDEPDRLLLETTVTKGETFHKQQETLIVWTESSPDGPTGGTDMALSFQEPDGCASIWSVSFLNHPWRFRLTVSIQGGDPRRPTKL